MNKMILIEGMSCHHCTDRVQKALSSIDGVTVASTSIDEKNAVIKLHKEVANDALKQAVEQAGYDVIDIREI